MGLEIFRRLMQRDTATSPTVEPVSQPRSWRDELVSEALKWLFVREHGGNNRGAEVEMFQKAVDNRAIGEAWCMAYVQFCVKQVGKRLGLSDKIFDSEHCMTVWAKTPAECRVPLADVQPGDIVIWRHGNTVSGHTGFVEALIRDKFGYIVGLRTIEGNTSDASFRDGDGVFRRARNHKNDGSMIVVGFLRAF